MDLLNIDELNAYIGKPYIINDKILIKQATIKQIADYGEKAYFSLIQTITATPSDMLVQLHDIGVDWEEISDFELFMMIAPTLKPKTTDIIFGDLDFTKFKIYKNPQNDEVVMGDADSEIVIDRIIYERIVGYLRKIHGFKKNILAPADKQTKKFMIEMERDKLKQSGNKKYKSYLVPLISAMQTRAGYTKEYIMNMNIVEFFTIIHRMQVVQEADALLHGCYSGMINTKDIQQSKLNWMRELENE